MKILGFLTNVVMILSVLGALAVIAAMGVMWLDEQDTKIVSYRVGDCVAFRADYAERKDESQRFRVEYSTAEVFTIRPYPAPLHRPVVGYEVPKDLAYYFLKINCTKGT